jgi:hypothetical protein
MEVKTLRPSWFSAAIAAAIITAATACGGQADSADSIDDNDALTRSMCPSRNADAIEDGRIAGGSIARQAWDGFKDCSQFALFETIVENDMAELACDGNAYVICRCEGQRKGVAEALAELKAACDEASTQNPTPTVAPPASELETQCTGRDRDAYDTGTVLGESLAVQAWKGCSNTSAYEEAIANAAKLLVAPSGASSYVVCRLMGTKDGLTTKAKALVATCASSAVVP